MEFKTNDKEADELLYYAIKKSIIYFVHETELEGQEKKLRTPFNLSDLDFHHA